MMPMIRLKKVTGDSIGTVMCRCWRNRLAPSTWAAS